MNSYINMPLYKDVVIPRRDNNEGESCRNRKYEKDYSP